MRLGPDILEEQPKIRLRVEHEEDRQPVPFVGVQRFDGSGNGYGTNDREPARRFTCFGHDANRHTVGTTGLGGGNLRPLIMFARARIRRDMICEPGAAQNVSGSEVTARCIQRPARL